MSRKTTKTAKTVKPEILVYVGPTIPTVASHNTILNNGLTEALITAQANEPAFKGLVVTLDRLSAAMNDIANKRGATYAFYEKALNYNA